jgi:hypothetical protein
MISTLVLSTAASHHLTFAEAASITEAEGYVATS